MSHFNWRSLILKRVIFMGTPKYAREILDALIKDRDIEVLFVITQPDRAVGRKRRVTPSEVKVLALESGIEVIQPESLKDKDIYKKILLANPDLIIVSAFGQLLPESILNIAPSINLHASLLPKYRGASPIQQAILNGDEFTGVTAMLMDKGLDSGDILAYKFLKIGDNILLPELTDELTKLASLLTIETVKKFDTINPIPQTRAISTHCKKIKREDGLVDFSDALTLYRKYRAFYSWPDIFLRSGLKLLDIRLLDRDSKNRAGEILEIKRDSIIVGCESGKVEIFKLQPKSKRAMSAKAYCIGRRVAIGDNLF